MVVMVKMVVMMRYSQSFEYYVLGKVVVGFRSHDSPRSPPTAQPFVSGNAIMKN